MVVPTMVREILRRRSVMGIELPTFYGAELERLETIIEPVVIYNVGTCTYLGQSGPRFIQQSTKFEMIIYFYNAPFSVLYGRCWVFVARVELINDPF